MTTSTSAAAKFCQLERRRKFGDEDLGPLSVAACKSDVSSNLQAVGLRRSRNLSYSIECGLCRAGLLYRTQRTLKIRWVGPSLTPGERAPPAASRRAFRGGLN
jgi:hypothetical protein